MKISFYKYQGTGNDFVLIDHRNKTTSFEKSLVARLCHRKFGIGADGLMLLQNKEGFDFEMVYYNADGQIGSMCGNGGRCIVAFAYRLGIIPQQKTKFWAADGQHEALVKTADYIELKMNAVKDIILNKDFVCLDTGSPHYVQFVEQVAEIDIYTSGKKIRNSPPFQKEGINVNFVEITKNKGLKVATYERGVEAETLSCGTGVTAASIAYHMTQNVQKSIIDIETKGGNLQVKFDKEEDRYCNIWLSGSARLVFEGEIEI